MTSKSSERSYEDADDALSYGEIKALCAGNPLIKEKMNLDMDVSKLKLLKSEHQNQRYRLQDNLLAKFPKQIKEMKVYIEILKLDIEKLNTSTNKVKDGMSPMEIMGKLYIKPGEVGDALIMVSKEIKHKQPMKIGSYCGFEIFISFDSISSVKCHLKNSITYTIDLGTDHHGNISHINNALEKIPEKLHSSELELENLYNQVENVKIELEKPFPLAAELAEKSARLAELDSILNMGSQTDVTHEPINNANNKTSDIAYTSIKKLIILKQMRFHDYLI